MTDILNREERSERMALVRGRDTKPELAVRRLVHAMGYRYRLHRPDLPGRPDIIFPSRRKIIFVHGCFWHRHSACRLARMPKSRKDYWMPKLDGNQSRDERNQAELRRMGWAVLVVWECQIKDVGSLVKSVKRFIED